MTTPDWMPPLQVYPSPVAARSWSHGEMVLINEWAKRYAIAAVEAYKRSLRPVAYMNTESPYSILSLVPWAGNPNNVPLYRLDGGDDDAA